MKVMSTYPLRLPRSIKDAVVRISKEDGTSINQFVTTAVAEKLAVMSTARFFAARRSRGKLKLFDAIMKRRGGQKPRAGDEFRRRLLAAAKARGPTAARKMAAEFLPVDNEALALAEAPTVREVPGRYRVKPARRR
jgi:hypothetical protein